MARRHRIEVAGVPQHVVQRGVDRSVCFCDEFDFQFYLASLREAAAVHGVRVHAYVLMTNHSHLLMTQDALGGMSSTMQCLGRRYVRRFNDRYRRTGTLWEGRFKSCLVDTEQYVLTCYRYIEMNPVRACMVDNPLDYRWSSVHANAAGATDPLLDPHETYLALSSDDRVRQERYRELLAQATDPEALAAIRHHVNQGAALGSRRFQQQIRELTGREVGFRKPGRPRKR